MASVAVIQAATPAYLAPLRPFSLGEHGEIDMVYSSSTETVAAIYCPGAFADGAWRIRSFWSFSTNIRLGADDPCRPLNAQPPRRAFKSGE